MIKDPNEPLDPGDRRPLPPDFGKPTHTVLPFGKRPLPPGRKGASFDLSDDEIRELRAFFQKPREDDEVEDNPLSMLKAVIRDMETGKINPAAMFIGLIDYKPDGTEDYPAYITGLSRLALRGLLYSYLENLP